MPKNYYLNLYKGPENEYFSPFSLILSSLFFAGNIFFVLFFYYF